jgi:hypothetical protein
MTMPARKPPKRRTRLTAVKPPVEPEATAPVEAVETPPEEPPAFTPEQLADEAPPVDESPVTADDVEEAVVIAQTLDGTPVEIPAEVAEKVAEVQSETARLVVRPSLGRSVVYDNYGQPCPAVVCKAYPDDRVDLAVFSAEMTPACHPRKNVPYKADGGVGSWRWWHDMETLEEG